MRLGTQMRECTLQKSTVARRASFEVALFVGIERKRGLAQCNKHALSRVEVVRRESGTGTKRHFRLFHASNDERAASSQSPFRDSSQKA